MFGKTNDDLICKSLVHKKPCCVLSNSIDTIFEDLKNNIVGLNSEMGNGKTVMTEIIKCNAISMGYDVFTFKEKTDTFDEELDEIRKWSKKHLVVVENYHNYIDVLEHLNLKLNSNSHLLLTERDIFEDIFSSRVEEIFSKKYLTFDLNYLPDEELKQFIKIFELYGFGGHLRKLGSFHAQLDYLKNKLNRSMFLILLDLMKSPYMRKKSEYLFVDLKKKLQKTPKTYEAFIALLILSVMGREYHVIDFYDLLGNDVRLQNNFFKDVNVQQIISHDRGYISVKSSILANHILQTFIKDTHLILTILLKLIDNAIEKENYSDLARSLVNYSVLERILPQTKRDELVDFYENTKKYHFFSNSAHFWLQYAIAMISLHKFDRAETYFQNVYGLVKRKGWSDTTKFDNHYARFLLDKNIHSNQNDNFIEDFKEAHRKLMYQITQNSNYFFPYKVASNYASFYNKFESEINKNPNKEYIQNAINSVINTISKISDEKLKENHFVKDCYEKLSLLQKNWS